MNKEQAILFLVATPCVTFIVGFLIGYFTGLNLPKGGRQ